MPFQENIVPGGWQSPSKTCISLGRKSAFVACSTPGKHKGAAGGNPADPGERPALSPAIADHLHVVPGVSTRHGGETRSLQPPRPVAHAVCAPRLRRASARPSHEAERTAVRIGSSAPKPSCPELQHGCSAACARWPGAARAGAAQTPSLPNSADGNDNRANRRGLGALSVLARALRLSCLHALRIERGRSRPPVPSLCTPLGGSHVCRAGACAYHVTRTRARPDFGGTP